MEGYRPDLLDELCSAGEVVWTGAGPIGSGDGRVVLSFRDRAALLSPSRPTDPPSGPTHDAIRAHLAAHGASFWTELLAAAGNAPEREVLAALWDLVWAGEVTNDSLAPLRAVRGRGARAKRDSRGRPRPGRLTRLDPPAAAGRWSSVASLREPAPAPTERAHALALQLLERHGVLTREAVRAEGVTGGYAAVYGVLRALEEGGRARRGYLVAGLGAAQFALPGAVDHLRARRTEPDAAPLVLAATDPAQPYGAALAWPEADDGSARPSRAAGAFAVLDAGTPIAYLERGGRKVSTFGADNADRWAEALAAMVKDSRLRQLEITHVDGIPARTSPAAEALRATGFRDAYRGLVLRD